MKTGTGPHRYCFDHVISCVGWNGDNRIFDENVMPQWDKHGKFPVADEKHESVNIPDLFIAGALIHGRDYGKTPVITPNNLIYPGELTYLMDITHVIFAYMITLIILMMTLLTLLTLMIPLTMLLMMAGWVCARLQISSEMGVPGHGGALLPCTNQCSKGDCDGDQRSRRGRSNDYHAFAKCFVVLSDVRRAL